MRRIVLDTNVLISGIIITAGPSAIIVDAIQKGELQIIISIPLLREFSEVITRPHILRKYPLVAEHADSLVDFLRANAIIVPGLPDSVPLVKEDPDDDYVLACAEDGNADCIVTGDNHLLQLIRHKEIRILSPRQFTDIMDK